VCCSVLQCVAVRCSVLQCVAMRCSVLQCVSMHCSVLQCIAVCCSVLQSVCSMFYSVLQCVVVTSVHYQIDIFGVLQCVAVCYSVLQCFEYTTYPHLQRHFSKVFSQLQSQSCQSLLPRFSGKRPMGWLRLGGSLKS